jgi:prepilin-type N-terminal cleavage/methylation domain-containing protein
MKTDDIAKSPSGRMNAQRASWGGGGARRIHFAWRGRETIPRLAKWPEETFCEVVKTDSGFTLIELLITMSLLGIIASFAMPSFLTTVDNSRSTTCLLYRQNIQVATDVYIRMNSLQVDDSMPTIATLISENLLPEEHECPSGGIYVWNTALYKGITQPFYLYCSIHFAAP